MGLLDKIIHFFIDHFLYYCAYNKGTKMKIKLYIKFMLLPLIFFIGCESDDDEGADSIIGTWSGQSWVEYDTTCTGDILDTSGDVITITFTETDFSILSTESFEGWCDGTVTDNVCDEDGDTYTLSDFEEECTEDGDATYSNGICSTIEPQVGTYILSDSLYITNTDTDNDIDESSCNSLTEDGITTSFDNGVCTISYTQALPLTFDGNTISWTNVYVSTEDEDSYCDVTTLTKQ